MGYISNFVVRVTIPLCLLGGFGNTGSYLATKEHLVNSKIEGKEITFEKKKKPPYISPFTQAGYSIEHLLFGIGKELAEERFKDGEFDAIIKEYKDKVSKGKP